MSPLVEEGIKPGALEFFDCLHEGITKTSTGKTGCKLLATARETSRDVVTTGKKANEDCAWTREGDGGVREDGIRCVDDDMVSVILSLRVCNGMGAVSRERITRAVRI